MKRLKEFIRRHRGALIFAGVLSAAVLILAGLALSTVKSFPRPEIGPGDWMIQSRLAMQVMQKVLRHKPEERVKMQFSAEEIRTMLRFVCNQDRISGVFSGRDTPERLPYQINYDGRFRGDVILGPHWGPFRFILHGSAKIEYSGNQFHVQEPRGSVGRLPIPPFILKPLIRKLLQRADRNVRIRQFHQAVESISIVPGGMEIDYRPDVVFHLISGGFSSI